MAERIGAGGRHQWQRLPMRMMTPLGPLRPALMVLAPEAARGSCAVPIGAVPAAEKRRGLANGVQPADVGEMEGEETG